MKTKLLYDSPKAKYLLFLLFILFSLKMSAIDDCGSIESFEFTNGHESVSIVDGYVYDFNDLPEHFYVNTKINGDSKSVRYVVENVDTGKKYSIIENLKPYTFPAGNKSWNLGKGKFKVKVTFYKYYLGIGECGSMTSTFTIGENACVADAGTLMSDMDMVTLANGTATISATVKDAPYVPSGYVNAYVLTKGDDLIITALGETPSFEVSETGMYTIHSIVFDPNTLDTSGVGGVSGIVVNGLLIQGGGTICASLDVAGAKVKVEDCVADAGTLMSDMDMVTLANGTATISATVKDAPYVPSGYVNAYVLTKGDDLIITALGETPSFEVSETGMYTIHSIVFDPNTLDTSGVAGLSGIVVNGLLIQGGGTICASLDVAGAKVDVSEGDTCDVYSGTLYSNNPINCLTDGTAFISAKVKNSPQLSSGYQQLYVLTEAFSLTILNVSATPEFEVNSRGFYRIHSLVYDPNTLDLSVVVPGQTTGFDVVNLIEANGICASLDVEGAVNLVIGSRWFCYFFNKFFGNTRTGKTNNSDKDSGNLNLDSIVNSYDSYEAFKDDFILANSTAKFFPNPVVNNLKVNIEVFDNEVMNYNIIDVSGRIVISGSAKSLQYGTQTIDTSRLGNGMYIVQFTSEFRTLTQKIVVNK